MKIVVLGGFGFIGKAVVEQYKSDGFETISLSRRNGLDLLDFASSKRRIREVKPDVIVNCAANVGSLHYVTDFAADVVDDNAQMILNMYRLIKEVCPHVTIINPIANCSYPGNVDLYIERNFWDGPVHESVWSYGNSRRFLVVVSECYAMQYGIKSLNFLIPNAYGPGDSLDPYKTHALNGLIIRMLKAKRSNKSEFEIWGTGKPIREWIYVRDIAKLFRYSIEKLDIQINPINFGQNIGYSIKEIANIIKKIIGYKGAIIFNTKYNDGALKKVMDDTLFRKKFGAFDFTDIKKGIAETVDYYENIL